MQRQMIWMVITALVLTAVIGAGAVIAADYNISEYVINGGGGRVEASPYALNASIGESVVGNTANGAYQLRGGYFLGGGVYNIYLPLVLRN